MKIPSTHNSPDEIDEESTGFPAVRSWGAMYLIVAEVFILYVALLIALERIFH